MNLTDLIPSGQLNKLTHDCPDEKEKYHSRCERIKKAYSEDIIKCLRECGSISSDPILEYKICMSMLATIDLAIEQATGRTQ